MRILYQLLVVLFIMLQGAAGQPLVSQRYEPCAARNGHCVRGICRRPYYWIGTCGIGFSCCRK
ncbi:GLL7 protein, partial [Ciconia maguari]|nr:GLL7 protein [Ciconia maguari]